MDAPILADNKPGAESLRSVSLERLTVFESIIYAPFDFNR